MKPSDRIKQLSRKFIPDDMEMDADPHQNIRMLIAKQEAIMKFLDELWQTGVLPESEK